MIAFSHLNYSVPLRLLPFKTAHDLPELEILGSLNPFRDTNKLNIWLRPALHIAVLAQ